MKNTIPKKLTPCHQAALDYLALEFSVIPIIKGDKKPCIKWDIYQQRLPTVEEIDNWFKNFPNAQLGIITGHISNLVIVDVDKKTGGLESAKKLLLPITVIAKTGGGGFHYYYRPNSKTIIKNSAGKIAPGIDIRGDGGYVVTPPSTHISGNIYEWINPPQDQKITTAPEWLEQQNIKQHKNKIDIITLPKLTINEGNRNSEVTRLVGWLLHELPKSLYESIGWPWIQQFNDKQVNPPLSEKELRSIFDSIKNTELSKQNNANFLPLSWSDFNKLEFPPERWRIKNLIPLQGVVIIASPSGEKKTWLAMEMAKSVALGTDFLSHVDFQTTQCNVLYIDMEMSRDELQRRGRLLGFNITKDKIWLLKSDSFNLNNEQIVRQVFNFIQEKNINIIFVDTLRAVAGGMPEEKAEEVRKFFNRLMPLKNKGVVIIFLDHCRKPLPHEGKVPKKEQLFASQDKVASVEGLIMIRSEGQSNTIMVYHLKNRIGKEYKPFNIIVTDHEDGESTTMAFAGMIEKKEIKKIDAAKELITLNLKEEPKTRKDFLAIGETNDIRERNMSEALRQLEKDKIIYTKKIGKENQYFLILPGQI